MKWRHFWRQGKYFQGENVDKICLKHLYYNQFKLGSKCVHQCYASAQNMGDSLRRKWWKPKLFSGFYRYSFDIIVYNFKIHSLILVLILGTVSGIDFSPGLFYSQYFICHISHTNPSTWIFLTSVWEVVTFTFILKEISLFKNGKYILFEYAFFISLHIDNIIPVYVTDM